MKTIVVPIHLDALYLDEPASCAEPRINFDRLPYFDGAKDVQANIPFLGEELQSIPFRDLPNGLEAGMHLHWALPDALTKSIPTPILTKYDLRKLLREQPSKEVERDLDEIWSYLLEHEYIAEINGDYASILVDAATILKRIEVVDNGLLKSKPSLITLFSPKSTHFPPVPDRWEIKRIKKGMASKEWILESSYVHSWGEKPSPNSTPFPTGGPAWIDPEIYSWDDIKNLYHNSEEDEYLSFNTNENNSKCLVLTTSRRTKNKFHIRPSEKTLIGITDFNPHYPWVGQEQGGDKLFYRITVHDQLPKKYLKLENLKDLKVGEVGAPYFRYIGRTFPKTEKVNSIFDNEIPGRYLSLPLTALGYGNATFAAFYPNCRGVFGFWDDFLEFIEELSKKIDQDKLLNYEVKGTYKEKTLNFLSIFIRDFVNRIEKFIKKNTKAKQLTDALKEAIKNHFKWDIDLEDYCDAIIAELGDGVLLKTDLELIRDAFLKPTFFPEEISLVGKVTLNSEIKTKPVNTETYLAIGQTGTEALSAFLGNTLLNEGEKKDQRLIEDFLESLQFSSQLAHLQVDIGATFKALRHQKGFKAYTGGTIWRVRKAHEGKEPEEHDLPDSQITLPDEVADVLNNLNQAQIAYDRLAWRLESTRKQLYTDWTKYMVSQYPPDVWEADYPDIDELRFLIQQTGLEKLNVLEADQINQQYIIETKKQDLQTTLNKLQQEKEKDAPLYVLQQKGNNRFYQPTEPVVLLSGDQLKASPKHGQDGMLHCGIVNGSFTLDMPPELERNEFFGKTQPLKAFQHPLLMDWQIEYYPDAGLLDSNVQQTGYPADYLISQYEVDPENPELKTIIPAFAEGSHSFWGSTVLTTGAQNHLQDTLDNFIKEKISQQPFSLPFIGLSLSAPEHYLQLSKSLTFGEASFTLAIWVKMSDGAKGSMLGVYYNWENIYSANLAEFYISGAGQIGFMWGIVGDGNIDTVLQGQKDIRDDQWHLVVFVVERNQDDPSIQIFLDGEIEAELSQAITLNTLLKEQPAHRIGTNLGDHNFNGQIAEMAYWNTVIQPEKLQYGFSKAPYRPASHWVFNAFNEELEIKDLGTQNNTATLVNIKEEDFIETSFNKIFNWYFSRPSLEKYGKLLGEKSVSEVYSTFIKDQHPTDLENALQRDSWHLTTALFARKLMEDNPVMTQSLGGFNDALLMLKSGFQLTVHDPIGFPEYQDFTKEVSKAVGKLNFTSILPHNAFFPIRSGSAKLSDLRLLDTFGREIVRLSDLHQRNLLASETMQTVLPYDIGLKPRFTQPVRLDFKWLSAYDDSLEMNDHPASSPICGWVLINEMDESLMVYNQQGNALGYIDRTGKWRVFPGHTGPVIPEAIGNNHLRRLVRWICKQTQKEGTPAAFEDFFNNINTALDNIESDHSAHHQGIALLTSQPLALVRASVQLELKGEPALHQGWDELKDDLTTLLETGAVKRKSLNFEQVKVPFRLGEDQKLNDGLVAYWIDAADGESYHNDQYYTPINPDSQTDLSLEAHGSDMIAQSPGLHLNLLMDPRGALHANCGLLPTATLQIPPDQINKALQTIEIIFLTAPLLTQRGQVQISLPQEPGYHWSWLAKSDNAWNEITTHGHLQKPDLISEFGNQGTFLWNTLLKNGVLKLAVGDVALIQNISSKDPTNTLWNSIPENLLPKLQLYLGSRQITSFQLSAAFSGPQEIREGWLKLHPDTKTDTP